MEGAGIMNMDGYLYVASVGSQLWHMARPDSDIDYFAIYQAKSTDILLGKNCMESHHTLKGDDDVQSHELGQTVASLTQCNLNFLIGLFSPLTIKPWDELDALRYLAKQNLSRACYKSIHGMAVGNFNKYIKTGKETGAPAQKRMNTICRSIQMGITLLKTGEFEFKPFEGASPDTVVTMIQMLDAAHENSKLPAKPPCPEKLEAWLLERRMEAIRDEFGFVERND